MKKRNGFVSNSSSCSFVVAGIKLGPGELEDLLAEYGDPGLDDCEQDEVLLKSIGFGLHSAEYDGRDDILGIQVASGSSDDMMDNTETALAELFAKLTEMKKKFLLRGEVTLYTGQRGC